MELSKKSWHYFLHRVMYGNNAPEPKNLCPYFWKSIVFGIIFGVVFIPLAVPFIIFEKVWTTFTKDHEPPTVFDDGICSSYSFLTVAFDIVLFILYSMIAMWFYPWKKGDDNIFQIAGSKGFVVLFVGIGAFIWKRVEKTREKKRKKKYEQSASTIVEDKPNIIVEAVKAWYKRNCPMIKWK